MPSKLAKTSTGRSNKKKENNKKTCKSSKNEDSSYLSISGTSDQMNRSKDIDNLTSANLSSELKDSTNKMNLLKETSKTTLSILPKQESSTINTEEITSMSSSAKFSKKTSATLSTQPESEKSKNNKRKPVKKSSHHRKLLNISHHHSFNCSSLNSSNPNLKSNKKITDYFQIRKSSRKCRSDIEKEKRQVIEEAIKTMKEDGLEIRLIENKGRGIFATKKFYRGDFVCEYAGEMISYKLAKIREERYAQDPSIGCYMYFFEYKSKGYCIDATAETDRLGRLLNHSKMGGNCHTKLFELNSRPYLILVASRDVEPGEEMTYDYGDRNKISLESHPWLAE